MILCRISGVLAIAFTLMFVFSPATSFAAVVTLQTANNSVGNQAYSGLGVEFTVNSAITVSELGIFDSGQDGLSTTLSAYLFKRTGPSAGSIVANTLFTSSDPGTLVNDYRFKSITPIDLAAGDYVLVGYGFSDSDPEHNSNISGNAETFTSSSLVSFVQSLYGGGNDPPGTFPTQTFAPNGFSAANMMFDASGGPAAPEPCSLAIWGGISALGVAVGASRRRKAGKEGAARIEFQQSI
jgi:hypothetical protein